MKTVEVTRHKSTVLGGAEIGTLSIAREIFRKEGIAGINKGVNAVAVRQCTNWGSRFGIARVVEGYLRKLKGEEAGSPLGATERIGASAISGALSCWVRKNWV